MFINIKQKGYLKIHFIFLFLTIVLFVLSVFYGYTFYGKLIDRIIVFGYIISTIYCLFKNKVNKGFKFYNWLILVFPIILTLYEPLFIFVLIVNLLGGNSYKAQGNYEVRHVPSPFTHMSYEVLRRDLVFEKTIGVFKTENEFDKNFEVQVDKRNSKITYKTLNGNLVNEKFEKKE